MIDREEIIRMAREAGILEPIELLESNQWRQDTIRELERFAALVVAAEREACAQICDRYAMADHANYADSCAEEIRARGNNQDASS